MNVRNLMHGEKCEKKNTNPEDVVLLALFNLNTQLVIHREKKN